MGNVQKMGRERDVETYVIHLVGDILEPALRRLDARDHLS
jgi:hypothetical protein